MPRLQFPSQSPPPPRPSHSCPLGPHTDQFSLKGWGVVVGTGPFPTATKDQGQGFQQSNSQKPSLFIFHSCRSTSLQKLSGFWRGRRVIWAPTRPEIVFAHCRGWLDLRSNLTINSTESEMYKSVKAAAGWFPASPWGPELRPSVLCKGPGAGGGHRILPQERTGLPTQQKCAQGQARGCVPRCHGPRRPRGFRGGLRPAFMSAL